MLILGKTVAVGSLSDDKLWVLESGGGDDGKGVTCLVCKCGGSKQVSSRNWLLTPCEMFSLRRIEMFGVWLLMSAALSLCCAWPN